MTAALSRRQADTAACERRLSVTAAECREALAHKLKSAERILLVRTVRVRAMQFVVARGSHETIPR